MLKKTNKLLLFMMLLLLNVGLLAQKGTLTGVIKDADETLIGATVGIKGTGLGTITNFDGMYMLSLEPGTYTL